MRKSTGRISDTLWNGWKPFGTTAIPTKDSWNTIRKEQKDIDYSADFTSVRISLGMANLPAREKEEIMMKLDEMEEICAQVVPRSKKWESLREYLIWVSGKEADVAMEILPLFFRINDIITKRQEV